MYETPATAVNGPGAWTAKLKETAVNERTGTCEDCSTTFAAPGSRGPMPKCCPECTKVRRRLFEQEWTSARPLRVRPVIQIVCSDCGVEFSWSSRGLPPGRCESCAKDRRRKAARERGRIRRAAAKTGDSRRLGVCMECFTEFEGPARGSLPRRCPPCTVEWNRGRHKETEGRAETSRRYLLRNKYGMSTADWDTLYASQGGRCAICRRPEEESGRLHVDHCHGSGAIRGLLCHSCNTAIGHLREDPEIIRAAVAYVEYHGSMALQA